MNKYVVAAVLLAAFAFGSPAMAQTKPTIAVIVKDTTSLYWQTVLAGARNAGQDLGVNVVELGAQSESDVVGQIGILECNQPEGLTGALYNLYFKTILPKVGGLISGNPRAYSYLPASVERFPRPPRMLQLIRDAGFINATWTSYVFGTAGLYHATKP